MLRSSKLVTCGQMTRDEAVELGKGNDLAGDEPSSLGWFLEEFGLTRKDFDEIAIERRRHVPYLRIRSRVVRRLRGPRGEKIRMV